MFLAKWTCQTYIQLIVDVNAEWKLMVVLHNSSCLANLLVHGLLCSRHCGYPVIQSNPYVIFIQHYITLRCILHPAHKTLRLIIQLLCAQVTQPIASKLFNETSKMWMYRSVTRSLCTDRNVFWKAFTEANGSDWVSLSLQYWPSPETTNGRSLNLRLLGCCPPQND